MPLHISGAEGRVTLIHPSKNKMFAHLPVFKKAYISCLRVHPSNANWLFCGADHGKVALIDTGLTGSSNYEISWQKIKTVMVWFLVGVGLIFKFDIFEKTDCNIYLSLWKNLILGQI